MKVIIAGWVKGLMTSARHVVTTVFCRDSTNKCQVVSAKYCQRERIGSITPISAAQIGATVR
jgi:uncharacterized protein (UPF0264 family)